MKRIPSLNINLTDKCNFNCIYCPEYGESLEKAETLCDVESILMLIEVSREVGINVLRLTGGEPLKEFQRASSFIKEAIRVNYKKIILNTNGLQLNNYFDELSAFKDYITLKISIDSLNEITFKQLTRSNKFEKVYASLVKYIESGFKIGINTVVTKLNQHEVLDLIAFADKNKIDLKFLGVSSFGGKVNSTDYVVSFQDFVKKTTDKFQNVIHEKLIGGVGITMPTIQLSESKVFFVDHDNKKTENKLYSESCKKNCKLYPCEYGLLHIALSANGKLRYCRLLKDNFFEINNCRNRLTLRKILGNYINEFN